MKLPLEPPRLIIFDWDGTLADSISRILFCFFESYKNFNLKPPTEAAIRTTIGLPLKQGFVRLGVGLKKPGLPALAAIYRDLWLDPDLPPSPLFPKVRTLLERLTNANHILAVATGKSRAGLNRETKHHQVSHFFQATRCGDESLAKPNPDMLLTLLQATNTQAHQAIMLGDSPLDLEMANRAAIPAIGVLTGCGDAASLGALQPVTSIAAIHQLEQLWSVAHA